jgi:hypothetical protein
VHGAPIGGGGGGEAEQAQAEELDVLEVAPSVVLMLLTAALLVLSLLFYLGACSRLSLPPSLSGTRPRQMIADDPRMNDSLFETLLRRRG